MPLRAMRTWTDVPRYFCDKESYLSWLTLINVAFPYHATHIFSSNNVSALIIFPQAFKNLFLSLSTSEVLKPR